MAIALRPQICDVTSPYVLADEGTGSITSQVAAEYTPCMLDRQDNKTKKSERERYGYLKSTM